MSNLTVYKNLKFRSTRLLFIFTGSIFPILHAHFCCLIFGWPLCIGVKYTSSRYLQSEMNVWHKSENFMGTKIIFAYWIVHQGSSSYWTTYNVSKGGKNGMHTLMLTRKFFVTFASQKKMTMCKKYEFGNKRNHLTYLNYGTAHIGQLWFIHLV